MYLTSKLQYTAVPCNTLLYPAPCPLTRRKLAQTPVSRIPARRSFSILPLPPTHANPSNPRPEHKTHTHTLSLTHTTHTHVHTGKNTHKCKPRANTTTRPKPSNAPALPCRTRPPSQLPSCDAWAEAYGNRELWCSMQGRAGETRRR